MSRKSLGASAGRLRDTVMGFSPGQKLVALVAVAAIVIGGYFFSQWAGTPTMAPLYTDLSSEDASAIGARNPTVHTTRAAASKRTLPGYCASGIRCTAR